jgi:hypothetical protein
MGQAGLSGPSAAAGRLDLNKIYVIFTQPDQKLWYDGYGHRAPRSTGAPPFSIHTYRRLYEDRFLDQRLKEFQNGIRGF